MNQQLPDIVSAAPVKNESPIGTGRALHDRSDATDRARGRGERAHEQSGKTRANDLAIPHVDRPPSMSPSTSILEGIGQE